jgi:hypothetical protein
MPQEELMTLQRGLADMISGQFSPGEEEEIRHALLEAEAGFERGEGVSGDEARRWLGLV